MRFKISHIFCEGSRYANKLVNLGIEKKLDFKWFNVIPSIISLLLFIIGFNSSCSGGSSSLYVLYMSLFSFLFSLFFNEMLFFFGSR